MKTMKFSEAVDDVLSKEMDRDPRIVLLGEDIAAFRLPLYTRFGEERVRSAPISEAGFMGAAVAAAMAGLRPVVELWMVDFVTVALDALVNHAAKTEVLSGGLWKVPLVVRASGAVPLPWEPVPLGSASVRREGRDITMVSLGVGVFQCLEAAERLEKEGISSCVIDLRSVSPWDVAKVLESVAQTGRMLVVDEDYREFGLSGELAAAVLEAGVRASYARVCTEDTIPFAKDLAEKAVPHTQRIVEEARRMAEAPAQA